jgi:hypothetical protein
MDSLHIVHATTQMRDRMDAASRERQVRKVQGGSRIFKRRTRS